MDVKCPGTLFVHTQVTWGLSLTCERLRGFEFWIINHCDCFAGCYKITTVFSHAQTVVLCVGCSTVLCQPTGGKARLTEGCSFRRKQH
uniref:Ribosomal protein S27 n=1 Tax=Haplochromis burtoni TaxID=8153 RepID=A0A3Q3CY78_HAPBU